MKITNPTTNSLVAVRIIAVGACLFCAHYILFTTYIILSIKVCVDSENHDKRQVIQNVKKDI